VYLSSFCFALYKVKAYVTIVNDEKWSPLSFFLSTTLNVGKSLCDYSKWWEVEPT